MSFYVILFFAYAECMYVCMYMLAEFGIINENSVQ